MSLKINRRKVKKISSAFSSPLPPLLKRIYAARGISCDKEVEYSLAHLHNWKTLKDIERAAEILSRAVMQQKHILIVGDFDADGATSSALAVTALNSFGAAKTDYLVPNRFEFGYGLSPEIVEVAAASRPDILVTVDNGISSLEGINAAKALGMQVIVTDHHLAGEQLPAADAIVNPNQPGCAFPCKNIAGVGVIFYVMCAVRAVLARNKWFNETRPQPNMASLLDLVALGTVADVVPLDYNNRILVQQGLQRIRSGYARAGIQALIDIANRQNETLVASDMGFALGPRLNAAGRLDDMSLGIELLLTSEPEHARELALVLDTLNIRRKTIEEEMRQEAMIALQQIILDTDSSMPAGLCFYQTNWHQGVIGILASRVKEKTHHPVIAFARSDDGNAGERIIKGSARSIQGFHIRDALAAINSRHPSLLIAFGGHAMAAGLTIRESDFEAFNHAFIQIAHEQLTDEQLTTSIITDGELLPEEMSLSTAEQLKKAGPWGQGFPEPVFDGIFNVINQKMLKDKHLKLTLTHPESSEWIDAILFNADRNLWPVLEVKKVKAVYRLEVNEFRGNKTPQMLLSHLEAV